MKADIARRRPRESCMMKEAMFYEPLDATGGCSARSVRCTARSPPGGAAPAASASTSTRHSTRWSTTRSSLATSTRSRRSRSSISTRAVASYSIATVGCNFRCLHCQNYEISQQPKAKTPPSVRAAATHPDVLCLSLRDLDAPHSRGTRLRRRRSSPPRSAAAAEHRLHVHRADDLLRAGLRHRPAGGGEGLANVFVTNGYITEEALAVSRRIWTPPTSISRASTTRRTSA